MDLKIFTENIEQEALDQIYRLMSQPAFSDCKVRIMPDVHAGAGCVVGFTADLGDKVIPNIVGVDIGCGMLTTKLDLGLQKTINLEALDTVIRDYVPHGPATHESANEVIDSTLLQNMHCYDQIRNRNRIKKSVGTLGGGNHFIEVAQDSQNEYYLIIHTGSRNLGLQVAKHYQNLAIKNIKNSSGVDQIRQNLIDQYKQDGQESQLKEILEKFDAANKVNIPKELCYLTGDLRQQYLDDMSICQTYAEINRTSIRTTILRKMGWGKKESFHTVHNYIDFDDNIVRKGAISAQAGEHLLIPINMRDGSILGIGKGSSDWNNSAPHGAGRIMSRTQAKKNLDLEKYQDAMKDIFTTCVGYDTIDEAPMAYKSMDEIIDNIGESVEVIDILKPIYNFKSSS